MHDETGIRNSPIFAVDGTTRPIASFDDSVRERKRRHGISSRYHVAHGNDVCLSLGSASKTSVVLG